MKLAQVVGGVVVNVVVVDQEAVPDWCSGWPPCEHAGPGWSWDGENFTPPVTEEQEN